VRNAVSITRDRNQSQAAHSANGISWSDEWLSVSQRLHLHRVGYLPVKLNMSCIRMPASVQPFHRTQTMYLLPFWGRLYGPWRKKKKCRRKDAWT
jgi:hypothetical protein